MPTESSPMMASWLVLVREHKDENDKYGTLIHAEEHHNLIVNEGRVDILEDLFISTVTSPIQFAFLGVGSSSTAAAAGDTGLTSEITLSSSPAGSLSSRVQCYNTSNVTLSSSDIIAEVSGSFTEKIILQATLQTTDDNGCTIAEAGLFNLSTFSPSGDMFNHFILSQSISKTSAISVVFQVTIRV